MQTPNGEASPPAREASPMIRSAVERLARMLVEGGWPTGHPLPSERELSEQLDVSRLVVRASIRELAERGLVEIQPRCRPVFKGGLRRSAASLAAGYIALCLWPSMESDTEAAMLDGIRQGLPDQDLKFVIANMPGGSRESVLEAERRFLSSTAEDPSALGLILWYMGDQENLPWLRRVREAGKPMVFVDHRAPLGIEADFVGTDNLYAAGQVMARLLELGHRRIALLANLDPASSIALRAEAYRNALLDANVDFDPDLVRNAKNDDVDDVARQMAPLFELESPPTAIFCANDTLALAALIFLRSHGIEVPRDVSVVGFDGILRRHEDGGRLTTCVQNFARMGQAAVRLLAERVRSPHSSVYRHVLLEAPLVEYGSTAPPLVVSGSKQRSSSSAPRERTAST